MYERFKQGFWSEPPASADARLNWYSGAQKLGAGTGRNAASALVYRGKES
jgi:hypothetical protein